MSNKQGRKRTLGAGTQSYDETSHASSPTQRVTAASSTPIVDHNVNKLASDCGSVWVHPKRCKITSQTATDNFSATACKTAKNFPPVHSDGLQANISGDLSSAPLNPSAASCELIPERPLTENVFSLAPSAKSWFTPNSITGAEGSIVAPGLVKHSTCKRDTSTPKVVSSSSTFHASCIPAMLSSNIALPFDTRNVQYPCHKNEVASEMSSCEDNYAMLGSSPSSMHAESPEHLVGDTDKRSFFDQCSKPSKVVGTNPKLVLGSDTKAGTAEQGEHSEVTKEGSSHSRHRSSLTGLRRRQKSDSLIPRIVSLNLGMGEVVGAAARRRKSASHCRIGDNGKRHSSSSVPSVQSQDVWRKDDGGAEEVGDSQGCSDKSKSVSSPERELQGGDEKEAPCREDECHADTTAVEGAPCEEHSGHGDDNTENSDSPHSPPHSITLPELPEGYSELQESGLSAIDIFSADEEFGVETIRRRRALLGVDKEGRESLLKEATRKLSLKNKKRKRRTNDKLIDGSIIGGAPDDGLDGGKQKRVAPNYFVAIQVCNPEIHKALQDVQQTVMAGDEKLKDAMVPIPTLHLTIMVMHLATDEDVERAKLALMECHQLLSPHFENKKLSIWFHGLGHFNNQVMFAKIKDIDGILDTLYNVAETVENCYRRHGIQSTGERGFKPHLTVMKLSRAPSLRKKGVRRIKSELYRAHSARLFGNQPVTGFQLCSINKPKTEDGYYHKAHEVVFGKTPSLTPDPFDMDTSPEPSISPPVSELVRSATESITSGPDIVITAPSNQSEDNGLPSETKEPTTPSDEEAPPMPVANGEEEKPPLPKMEGDEPPASRPT